MRTRAAGGGGFGLVLVALLVWALWPSGPKPPREMTPEELRVEKSKLADELKYDLLADPPRLGQGARWTLAQVERRRPMIIRLRAICAQLGEPLDGLDKILQDLNELERMARQQLQGMP